MNDRAEWTFMVFLAGDNDLEPFGFRDLQEMKLVGSSDDVHIVAQVDSKSDQVTRRYHLSSGLGLAEDCVDALAETNTGDPEVLEDFVDWAATQYPASRYGLILWNHGNGWKDDDVYRAAARRGLNDVLTQGNIRSLRSGKSSRTLFCTSLEQLVQEAVERAILFDDSAADFLDSQEMRRVLQNVGPKVNGRLDLLGFDACLMNMIEVVYQVHDLCDVVVGSQEIEPGTGWPYDAILSILVQSPESSPQQLASVIVSAYTDYYTQHRPNLAVTQSAVSTGAIGPLVAAVDDLAGTLQDSIHDSRTIGLVFAALRGSQGYHDKEYVDLGDFCRQLSNLGSGSALEQKAAAVVDLIEGSDSAIVALGFHGPSVTAATGLSIYLPTRVLSPLYGRLQFARVCKWADFLKEFVG